MVIADTVGDDHRTEYRLDDHGINLYAVMLALLRFGDDWLAADSARAEGNRPTKINTKATGKVRNRLIAFVMESDCSGIAAALRRSRKAPRRQWICALRSSKAKCSCSPRRICGSRQ